MKVYQRFKKKYYNGAKQPLFRTKQYKTVQLLPDATCITKGVIYRDDLLKLIRRFDMPYFKKPQIGFEVISGGRDAFTGGVLDDNAVGALFSLRGHAYHPYMNFLMISNSANLRVGYYYLHRFQNNGQVWTTMGSVDETVHNLYVAFKVRF